MLRNLLPLFLLLSFCRSANAYDRIVPLPVLNPSLWNVHHDGGAPCQWFKDADHHGMRIIYKDASPHWGNLQCACTVPANAVALRFRLYKYSSSPTAQSYIWLFQPSGDGWLQRITVNGLGMGSLSNGWHDVSMPINGFLFQHRGTGVKDMPSVDMILIGCNYGDMEFTMSSMEWVTGGTGSTLPSVTSGLKIESGVRGNIGILNLSHLPDGFQTSIPPKKLAKILRKEGFGVTLLSAGDLADSNILTKPHFDVVILPYGPYFPAGARKAFISYLKNAGCFLTTDGYAFDKLIYWNGSGWSENAGVTASEMDSKLPATSLMNTRYGSSGDAMTFTPEQIGLFDPLDRILPNETLKLKLDEALFGVVKAPAGDTIGAEPLEGFSACGLIGDNNAVFPPVYRRWIPLLSVYDKQNRLCGTALAMMRNFDGVYKGSSWAFSGITNGKDLFMDSSAKRQVLTAVLDALVRNVFLYQLESDFASYKPGEMATLTSHIANYGKKEFKGKVIFRYEGRKLKEINADIAPNTERSFSVALKVKQGGILRNFSAELLGSNKKRIDYETGAFCVWNPKEFSRGDKIAWKNNYFHVNGKPQFLIGSNQTGMMFYSPHENPQTWNRDFARMERYHMHILRILHFSPFAANGEQGQSANTPSQLVNRPKFLRRKLDAIVQLAHAHNIAILLTLHDWQRMDLTDQELLDQGNWDKFWAARYKNVPGIFFDIQNEPNLEVADSPAIRVLWNQWLKNKYGDDSNLRTAWNLNPPGADMPNVPLGNMTDNWEDMHTADLWQFRAFLINRWIKANVQGVKSGDPNAGCTVGFIQMMSSADKIIGSKHLDFETTHYYGDPMNYPLVMKLIDRRFEGKGFSLGEFGAQEAHDARVRGDTNPNTAANIRRFEDVVHYCAGLGGAFALNWDLKDFDEMVFPWGLFQREDGLPKPWAKTFSELGQFLQYFHPAPAPLQTMLLLPDENRLGAHFHDIDNALLRSVGSLMDNNVNFGVIDEDSIGQMPSETKTLLWILPYCPANACFQKVVNWVRDGGTLYVSGDVAFDDLRRPTLLERRTELGVPDTTPPVSPFEAMKHPWNGRILKANLGKGKVFYVPYPIELSDSSDLKTVYAEFFKYAGVNPIPIQSSDASIRVMSIPLTNGGSLYSIVRTDGANNTITVSLPATKVTVQLGQYGAAFVATDAQNKIIGAESEGKLSIGEKLVATGKGHYGLVSLDGRDLRTSRKILILRHQLKKVKLVKTE